MLALRELQRQFLEEITRPHGTDTAVRSVLLDHIEPSKTLQAAERLDIYAGMYCARLVEVLADDFPKIVGVLGSERFDAVAHRYLERYPSCHPSLRHVGDRFPEYLATDPESVASGPPFLADLGTLEAARRDVFDAADAAPLQLEELRAVPIPAWGALRFALAPWVRLLRVEWPVQEIWANPEAAGQGAALPATSALLRVWRQAFTVYHAPMDAIEDAAMRALADGAPFRGICTALADTLPAEHAPQAAAALLLRWIEDGLLVWAR